MDAKLNLFNDIDPNSETAQPVIPIQPTEKPHPSVPTPIPSLSPPIEEDNENDTCHGCAIV